LEAQKHRICDETAHPEFKESLDLSLL